MPAGYDLEGYFEKVVREGFDSRMQELRARQDAGRPLKPLETYRERL